MNQKNEGQYLTAFYMSKQDSKVKAFLKTAPTLMNSKFTDITEN